MRKSSQSENMHKIRNTNLEVGPDVIADTTPAGNQLIPSEDDLNNDLSSKTAKRKLTSSSDGILEVNPSYNYEYPPKKITKTTNSEPSPVIEQDFIPSNSSASSTLSTFDNIDKYHQPSKVNANRNPTKPAPFPTSKDKIFEPLAMHAKQRHILSSNKGGLLETTRTGFPVESPESSVYQEQNLPRAHKEIEELTQDVAKQQFRESVFTASQNLECLSDDTSPQNITNLASVSSTVNTGSTVDLSFEDGDEEPSRTVVHPHISKPAQDTKSKAPSFPSAVVPDPPIFTKEFKDGAWYHTVLPELAAKARLKDRKERAQNVPEIIAKNHLLHQKQWDDIKWTNMDDGASHYMVTKHGTVGHAKLITPSEAHSHGFLTRLFDLQKLVLSKDVQQALASSRNKKPNTWTIGFSVQPGHQDGGIQIGPASKNGGSIITKVLSDSATLAHEMLVHGFKETSSDVYESRWIGEASIALGSEMNQSVTSLQINISEPAQNLDDDNALGSAGKLHVDKADNEGWFSIVFFLSHLPEDHFPGRFVLPGPKLACTTAPGSTLIFKGSCLHFGVTPRPYPKDLPLDSPLRYQRPKEITFPSLPEGTPYRRVVLVNYPTRTLMSPAFSKLRGEVFTSAALCVFGTKANFQEWKMKFAIRNAPYLFDDPVQWCERYSWDENGELKYPRHSIAIKALEIVARKSPHNAAWNNIILANQSVSCGKIWVSRDEQDESKRHTHRHGEVNWTQKEYLPLLNEESDTVPGNEKIG